MENNNQNNQNQSIQGNPEEVGKMIGAAVNEVISHRENEGSMQENSSNRENSSNSENDDQNNERSASNNNDDTIHGRGEAGLGGETEDGVRLTKDGRPDGRQVSPNRGGRGRDND